MARSKKFRAEPPEIAPKLMSMYNRFLDAMLRGETRHAAAIAAGAPQKTAGAWASKAWNSDYVQTRYKQLLKHIDADKLLTREELLLGLITEARNNDYGASHSARVNAWKTLAELQDFYPDGKNPGAVSSGVMLVPVMPASVEEWEKAALVHQQKLKKQTIEDADDGSKA